MSKPMTLANTEEIMRAVDDGDLDAPELMSWRSWMSYRAAEGMRPAIRRGDATTTTLAEEGMIWRKL